MSNSYLNRARPAPMPQSRYLVGLLLMCGVVGCNQQAEQGKFPSRPVKLVVPFGAGGGTDTYARIFERAIADNDLMDQPLVVINIGGAGATIGSRRVKDAEPDGYTMLILHEAILTAPQYGIVNYGPEAFEPIAGTGEQGMVIAVSEDSPYETLNDLMNAARDSPNSLAFGVNLGAMTHFAGLGLEQEVEGARFQFVQLGGGASRFESLDGKHTDVSGFSLEEFVRFQPAGLRGLAFIGDERHAALPDIPTAREQGIPLSMVNTFYWWVPKGTPQDRIDVLANMLEEAINTDYVRERMAEIHTESIFLQGDELHERLAKGTQQYATIMPREIQTLPNFGMLAALATGLLFVGVIIDHVRRNRTPAEPPSTEDLEAAEFTDRNGLAAACVLTVVVYVTLLSLQFVDFRMATTLCVLLLGGTLSHDRLAKALIYLIPLSLMMGFGLHALFTQVFSIDLP